MLEGKKILIVEDDEKMLGIYKKYFALKKETKTAHMLYAKNVKECIDALNNEKPSIMFLDLGLEDKFPPPGFDILKEYKDKLKIIVLSGYHEHEEQSLKDGAFMFLGKPTEPKTLIQLIIEHA